MSTGRLRTLVALGLVALGVMQGAMTAAAEGENIATLAGQNGSCEADDPQAFRTPSGPFPPTTASAVTFGTKVTSIVANGAGTKVYLNDSLARKRILEVDVITGGIRAVAGNGDIPADTDFDETDPLATNVTGQLAMAPNSNQINVLTANGQDLVLRRFAPGGALTPVAQWPAGGPGLREIAADALGNVYAVSGSSLWKISSGGQVSALPATGFSSPTALAVDAAGQNLYVGDSAADAVLRVDLRGGGTSTVLALTNPMGLAVSADGSVLFTAGNPPSPEGPKVIRLRNPASATPVQDVVVNETGLNGTAGDGGDPKLAALRGLTRLAVDASGKSLFMLVGDACAVRWVPELADPATPEGDDGGDGGEAPPPEQKKENPPVEPPKPPSQEQVVPQLEAPQAPAAQGDPSAGAQTPVPDGGAEGAPTGTPSFGSDANPFFSGVGSGSPGGFTFTPGPANGFSGFGAPAGGDAPLAASQGGTVSSPAVTPDGGTATATSATAATAQNSPGAVASSALPAPTGSATANPGLVSAGVRPADPATRYAMVARDDDDLPAFALIAVGVAVVGSGCVALIAAGSPAPRAHRRRRPAVGRAY